MERKVALVTGAAKRIGSAIARTLHEANYDVVVHCHRSVDEGNVLVASLNAVRPNSALMVQHDLSHEDVVTSLFSETYAWQKRLDVLVNNASIFCRDLIPDFSEGSTHEFFIRETAVRAAMARQATIWSDMFLLNVRIPFLLSQLAYPALKESKGVIINLTDIHSDKPLKGYSIYCQTKAALTMQTKALAREFAPSVRVNGIAPGAIVWPEHGNQLSRAVQEKIIAQTPLKRHGDPCFIGEAVLAFVKNAFITGQILNVDGGRSVV